VPPEIGETAAIIRIVRGLAAPLAPRKTERTPPDGLDVDALDGLDRLRAPRVKDIAQPDAKSWFAQPE